MKIFASAKLNLCLDILKKTAAGYHEVRTVLYEYKQLQNEISIEEALEIQNESRPQDLPNTACTLLKNHYKIDKNISIKIKRNIPPCSGLGGESSNAAAILKALNEMWALGLSLETLQKHAAQIGMDVPFFIKGGTALGTHFGEKLEQLPHLNLPITLIPKSQTEEAKTQRAYEALDLSLCGLQTSKTDKLIDAIKNAELQNIAANIHNDFESIQAVPQGWHLSGSGPSIFAYEPQA